MNKLMERLKALCEKAKVMALFSAVERQEASLEELELSFLERLVVLLEALVDSKHGDLVKRLRRNAALRWPHASLPDFKADPKCPIKFTSIKELGECAWVQDFRHVLITGPTGAGKTHLACALANEAILQEHSVLYYHYSELIRDLRIADKAGEDALARLKRKLIKVDILFMDDWGIQPLSKEERHLLFGVIEKREQKGSLIITSQYDPVSWHEAFIDPTVADSTLDRIVPFSITIDYNRDSFRGEMGRKLAAKPKRGRPKSPAKK